MACIWGSNCDCCRSWLQRCTSASLDSSFHRTLSTSRRRAILEMMVARSSAATLTPSGGEWWVLAATLLHFSLVLMPPCAVCYPSLLMQWRVLRFCVILMACCAVDIFIYVASLLPFDLCRKVCISILVHSQFVCALFFVSWWYVLLYLMIFSVCCNAEHCCHWYHWYFNWYHRYQWTDENSCNRSYAVKHGFDRK